LRTLLGMSLLALICAGSGCGVIGPASARQVAERFSDAVERPTDANFADHLTADAVVYLQGPARLSAAAFHNYLLEAQRGHTYFHRASQVYVTPAGAGWMVEILKDQPGQVDTTTAAAEQAPLWMEATIQDGRISRAWMHPTVETLKALHQPAETYAAKAAADQLPLPPAWRDGTPAMLAAARAAEPEEAHAPTVFSGEPFLLPLLGLGAVVVRLLLARRRPAPTAPARGTLLLELSSRRQLARKGPRGSSPP